MKFNITEGKSAIAGSCQSSAGGEKYLNALRKNLYLIDDVENNWVTRIGGSKDK